MNRTSLAVMLACLLIAGCGSQASTEAKPPPINYKERAENAQARIVKSYRLSDTESVKVLIIPGYPWGDRCVIYSNERGNTMQCSEISASRQ
ncbi:MAG: hypothetical protein HY661_19290 [Betaproteobacteria bacterium]|nr:hypothetical protein [Betaproteobacteria bacterium]